MEDLLNGADKFNELALLQKNVFRALSEIGFELRKWGTNSQSLKEQLRIPSTIWHNYHDWLSIAVNSNDLPNKLTKRTFLSNQARYSIYLV